MNIHHRKTIQRSQSMSQTIRLESLKIRDYHTISSKTITYFILGDNTYIPFAMNY